jgi:hypothetical protein
MKTMNTIKVISQLGWLFIAVGCGISPAKTISPTETVLRPQAITATYYVNNKSGSNCANSGTGLTQAQPWCDFTPVNTRTFQPGNQILLARGATWFQKLELKGSGTATDRIQVDAYGTGANPIIRGNNLATDRTIVMPNNPNFWNIRNLELSNAGMGIILKFTTLGNEGLKFENLYIHDIDLIVNGSPAQTDFPIGNSASIWMDMSATAMPTATQGVLKNIEILSVKTVKTIGPQIGGGVPNLTTAVYDLTIKNCSFGEAKLGWAFIHAKNVLVMDTFHDFTGLIALPQGVTGLFVWNDSNVTFVNNMFTNVPNTNSPDQSAVDLEGYVDQVKFYSNYFANNAGYGIEFLQLGGGSPPRGADDFNTNHVVSGNAFTGNGNASMFSIANPKLSTGSIRDNLTADSTFTSGNFSGFTLANNRNVGVADLYNAAKGFSGTQGANQWRYEFFNGSVYSNISSYSADLERWGSVGFVSRFNMQPDSCTTCWVSRTWTAPKSGTVSVRGRVLKNDITGGDGVKVRIVKNGVVVWPLNGTPQTIGFNDQVGTDTQLDGLIVSTGDVLRFEVNAIAGAGNDLTSWSPTVAYSSAAQSTSKIDDRNSQIAYTGAWATVSSSDYFQSTGTYTNSGGNQAQFSFTGTGINWYGVAGIDHGKADVFIDNVLDATVDLYAASRSIGIVYSKKGLSNDSHTIKIVSRNDRNASAIGNFVEIDALEPVAVANTKIDDRNTQISYSSGWSTIANASYYLSTGTFSTAAASQAQYSFSGSNISWYGVTGSDHGKADVFIDNVLDATVDLYSASRFTGVVYSKNGLSSGTHTIKIVVRSDRNPNATNNYVEVDALEIEATTIVATKLDDRATQVSYIGIWSQIAGSSYFSNTSTFTTSAGLEARLSFTGSSVKWYGVTGSDHGKADVFIDNVLEATVDLYSASRFTGVVYSKSGLSSGTHTIKIVVRSDRNPSATGNYVEVDALEFQ